MALTKLKTSGIADDAVTTDKLANAINTERTANTAKVSLEDNAVTLAKMAGGTDGQIITYDASGDPVAVGPGTDGQVLTSTGAGSPPAFEDASGTTINNNADNRVITGSGTAGTLEGEANLTYNGTRLNVATGDLAVTGAEGGDAQLRLTADEGDDGADYWRLESKASDNNFNLATYASGAWVDKLSMNTDGHLMLGTSTKGASTADDLTISNSGNMGITLRSTDSNYCNIFFSDGTSGDDEYRGAIQYYHSSNDMRFLTNATERVRILAGGGITFNGDTAAANALDDYEEGSWTPVWLFSPNNASGVTYATQSGQYVKIGRTVLIVLELTLSDKGTVSGAGYAQLAGLPFNVTQGSSISIGYFDNFTNSFMPAVAHASTAEQIYIAQLNSGGYSQDCQHSHLNNSTRMYVGGTYYSTA